MRTRPIGDVEKTEFTVHGDGGESLLDAITGFAEVSRTRYQGERVAAFVGERYFARTGSELQVTVLVERIDESIRKGAVISGGGKTGLLRLSWWSESSAADAVLEDIEEYCEENGLEFETHPPD